MADDATIRAENAVAGIPRRPEHEHRHGVTVIAQVIRWYRGSGPQPTMIEEGGDDDGSPRSA